MSYLYEPARISAATLPMVFRNSRTTTAEAEYLICDIYTNGTKRATFRKPWFSSAGDYTFDIDVQSVVARNIGPYTYQKSTIFGQLGVKELFGSSDMFTEYYLTTTLEVRGPDGYLATVSGSGETSSTLYALAAIRGLDNITMNAYYSPSAGGDFKFLTTAPATQQVGTQESFYVSWLSRGTNAAQLLFYNAAGSQVASAVIATADSVGDERFNSLSIGPANITGTGSLVILNGSLPTSFSNIAYYTYSAGTWIASAYTRKSELRRLDIVPRCGWAQRVYWMGLLGGCEQYTFQGQIVKKQADTGIIGEIAPNWQPALSPPVSAHARGLIKTQNEGELQIEIRESIPTEQGDWLRTLRKSPEVYIEDAGKYRAVVTQAGTANYEQGREALTEFEVVIIAGRETSQEL
jgi:hypothetical protein